MVKKMILVSLFLLMGPGQIFALEDSMNIKDLSLTLRFYYEKEKEQGVDVLFIEKTVRNTGSSKIVFSLYPHDYTVSDIGPKRAVKTTKTVDRRGAPSGPKPEDIVRLAPGAEYKYASWF